MRIVPKSSFSNSINAHSNALKKSFPKNTSVISGHNQSNINLGGESSNDDFNDNLIDLIPFQNTPQSFSTHVLPQAHASKIPEITETALSEAKANSDYIYTDLEPNNGTKYRTWYFGHDKDTDWCAIFVSYLFNKDGDSNLFVSNGENGDTGAGFSCRNSVEAGYGTWNSVWNKTDRSDFTPEEGDVVTFVWPQDVSLKESFKGSDDYTYWSSHVGYVYKVDDNSIYTVEGNKGGGGGIVATDSYELSDERINGYYRPNY